MASIKEVAKHAGVAISTVSKVLNNYPNVSEATKEKVNNSIKELQFVPNAVAAALSSKQSNRIAILVNLHGNIQAIDEINMQYIAGAIHAAKEQDLDVVTVFFSMIEGKSLEQVINFFRSQSINGIIVYGMNKNKKLIHKLVESSLFKMVLVDAPLINESTSCIWIDQEKAQFEVAEETMLMDSIPYKKILYIAGKKNAYVSEKRLLGMEAFANKYQLQVTIKQGEFSEKQAREITFAYGEQHDMIVCASDLMAIGAMRALMEMDIFRPVCGFDGITLMGYAGKQMNTVKQDFFHISGKAVEEMNRLLNGGSGMEVILAYSIERLKYIDIIK